MLTKKEEVIRAGRRRPVPENMAKPIKLAPIPTLQVKEPVERLIEFYHKVGWDKQKTLDPSLVKLTEQDWKQVLETEQAHAKEVYPEIHELDVYVGISMLWMNSGPSGGGRTPGKVELYPGWVK